MQHKDIKIETGTENKYLILNKIKELTYALDSLFKENGDKSIKYHHCAAIIYQTVHELIENNKREALHTIFGSAADDESAMKLMREIINDFAKDFAAAGNDDKKLSDVYNNFHYIDKDGRFPIRYEPTGEGTECKFKGKIIINDSFNKMDALENDKLVNVTYTIDPTDAAKLVSAIQTKLESLGLVIGRLTGTQNTTERHVSLGLRMPYSGALQQCVDEINKDIADTYFSTDAIVKVVIPTDMRTRLSAVGMLKPESEQTFTKYQLAIKKASGAVGNKLPQTHITHGNSLVVPATANEVNTVYQVAREMAIFAKIYGFDLDQALKNVLANDKKNEKPTSSVNTSSNLFKLNNVVVTQNNEINNREDNKRNLRS